ncbi:MAG: 30S ribosomal protein S1 [Candidatus Ancillula sp.]|jgi:small subunit ribosomal protein S1|nr:30S ribosomal protein S1 [Candidatus Ancillula sp.]
MEIKNNYKNQEELLNAIEKTIKYFKDGDIVEGEVVNIARDEVLVDVGYKAEGVIPVKELSVSRRVKPEDVVKVGDMISALVIQKEDNDGRLILSKKRAQFRQAWNDVAKIKEQDGIIEGTIVESVRGGGIVDIGLRAFLPASLLDTHRVRDLSPYIGQKMQFKIIELDEQRNNVVLSHRAIAEEQQSEARSELLENLKPGQIRKGIISSLVNFGAFVDLGGIDGLVHVSELSWNHVENAAEVVSVGQEVTVEVLGIEDGKDRVSLSIKSTQEDPWQTFARTHAIGQIVPGEIVKNVTFGTFVKVAENIEGLVHISEISGRRIESAKQVVNVGDKVFAKIMDIDLDRRRIALSIRQANELVDLESEEFDPSLYGAKQDYDANGNYIAPEGFDAETQEWKRGYEKQKAAWEADYIKARNLWEEHKDSVKRFIEIESKIDTESTADKKPSSGQGRRKGDSDKGASTQSFGEDLNVSTTLGDNAELAALQKTLKKEQDDESGKGDDK